MILTKNEFADPEYKLWNEMVGKDNCPVNVDGDPTPLLYQQAN